MDNQKVETIRQQLLATETEFASVTQIVTQQKKQRQFGIVGLIGFPVLVLLSDSLHMDALAVFAIISLIVGIVFLVLGYREKKEFMEKHQTAQSKIQELKSQLITAEHS